MVIFMLYKSKKLYAFILTLVLLSFVGHIGVGVRAKSVYDVPDKIVGDCAVTAGPRCRPAWRLREGGKRFQATPFDWMKEYSLDTFINCYQNEFSDFFKEIKIIPKKGERSHNGQNINSVRKEREDGDTTVHRQVKDTKNNIVSIHHFKDWLSLEEGQADVREKMLRRGKKVIDIFKRSDTIILLSDRQEESLDDFKKFINKFSKLYPDKNITLVVVRNSDSNRVRKSVVYRGFAHQSGEKAAQGERKKLMIIQYSFKNANTEGKKYKWEGNDAGWKKVIGDIELTNKIFGKKADLSKVEY